MARPVPDRDPSPPLPAWPFVIGIVGGVAAGKSSIARVLAEAGYVVLDADEEAKRILHAPALRPWLRKTFGPSVLRGDADATAVDTRYLADLVFAEPDSLRVLEAKLHPEVRQVLDRKRKEALARRESVILDVPLLLEGDYAEICDLILFVAVPDEVREARAVARGMTAADWRRREAAQMPVAEKRRRARRVVPNDRGPEVARAALADLIAYAKQQRGEDSKNDKDSDGRGSDDRDSSKGRP